MKSMKPAASQPGRIAGFTSSSRLKGPCKDAHGFHPPTDPCVSRAFSVLPPSFHATLGVSRHRLLRPTHLPGCDWDPNLPG